MKNLYIIRHAQTEYNLQGIVQGRRIDADLNATGRRQAKQFFDHYQHLNIDKIYVSSLKRTLQTVQPFIQNKHIAYEALSGLDEFDWGDLEGKTLNYTANKHYLNLIEAWKNGCLDAKNQNGESPNEVAIRQKKALQYILSKHDEETVLVCMHGRAMRLMMCILLNLPYTQMDTFLHSNTALYHLQMDKKIIKLITNNATDHLKIAINQ